MRINPFSLNGGGMLGAEAYDPLDPSAFMMAGPQQQQQAPFQLPNLPTTPGFWSSPEPLLDKPSLSERMLNAGLSMVAAAENGASTGASIAAGLKGYSDTIKEHKERLKKDRMERLAEYDLLGRIRERQMTELQTARKMQTLEQLKKDNPSLATLIDLDPDAAAGVIADRFKPRDRKIIEQNGVSYYADTGEPVLPGVPAPITSSGPFEGTSMDAQVANILLKGDPSTPDYLAAYNIAAQPKTVFGPDGVPQMVTPDMSAYRAPIIGAAGNAPIVTEPLAQITSEDGEITIPTIASDFSDPIMGIGRKAPPVAPVMDDPIAAPSLPTTTIQAPKMGPKGGITPIGKKTNFSGEALGNAGFASRMVEMNKILDDLPKTAQEAKTGKAGTVESVLSVVPFMDPVGAAVVHRNATPEQQQYLNAAQNWIRANLRKESGAVIGEQEMKDEYATYFPVPGDSKKVITQKEKLRKITTDAMIKSSAGAYEESEKKEPSENDAKRMIELLKKKAGGGR